jgi:hypothetical protein
MVDWRTAAEYMTTNESDGEWGWYCTGMSLSATKNDSNQTVSMFCYQQ